MYKKMSEDDDKTTMIESVDSSSRMVAFCAVAFATVAVTATLISFPLCFHYVQMIHSTTQAEIEYCKSSTKDMWKHMVDMKPEDQADGLDILLGRQARQIDDSCCTCQQGRSGPAGQPGRAGSDGLPGRDGNRGGPGRDATARDTEWLPIPPQCECESAAGPRGPAGRPGSAGNPGRAGNPGAAGRPGANGDQGPRGPPGGNGNPGQRGRPGAPGQLQPAGPAPAGTPGRPGNAGPRGPPGRPGNAGRDGQPGSRGSGGDQGPRGQPGRPGNAGRPGNDGAPGPRGSCDHCPPARLAPGY